MKFRIWKRPRPNRRSSLSEKFWPFQTRTAARVAKIKDPKKQHEDLVDILEKSKFNWRVFFVASSGFLTDSYNLFASNVILPSLAYVYLGNRDQSSELIINALTLAGSACGQVSFGILADIFGRQRLYGVELVIVIVATLGLVSVGPGYVAPNGESSMSAMNWIMVYRFLMGIGIGAEYPLSACITTEWASKKYRAQMLSAVFVMQPLGQLLAYGIGLAVLHGLKAPYGLEAADPTGRSRIGIDILWRIVAGVGGIPAVVALIFRWTIPETPRFTEEVKQNSVKAFWDSIDGTTSFLHRRPHRPSGGSRAGNDLAQAENGEGGTEGESGVAMVDFANDDIISTQRASYGNETPHLFSENDVQRQVDATTALEDDDIPRLDDDDEPWTQFTRERWNNYFHDGKGQGGNWRHIFGVSVCWAFLDFVFYGLGFNDPGTLARIWSSTESPFTSGTTPSWLLYSVATRADPSIFNVLNTNGKEFLLTCTIWALLGCVLLTNRINFINRRYTLIWTSLLIALLLLILAIVFPYCFHQGEAKIVLIILYAAIQFCFSYGPNTLLFIIPSEIFPTRYRCTCYGIAAASGKVGAALMQLTYHYFDDKRLKNMNSPSLGYLMYLFAGCMLVVAIVAWIYVPDVQLGGPKEKANTCIPSYWHDNKTLETLGRGRAALEEADRVGVVQKTAKVTGMVRERLKE